MRNDRLSVYQKFGLNLNNAIKNKFEIGLRILASRGNLKGVKKFMERKSKHEMFD